MSALFSFLGGSAFRMVWGEVSHYFTAKQEHKQEIERMELQARLDDATHQRNIAALKLQSELGIKEIEAKSDADSKLEELKAWAVAVTDVGKSTGIKWLDAWNGSIRPAVATWSVLAMTGAELGMYALSDNVQQIVGAALGIYLADRTLSKRGK